jgi:hypothetical protein
MPLRFDVVDAKGAAQRFAIEILQRALADHIEVEID